MSRFRSLLLLLGLVAMCLADTAPKASVTVVAVDPYGKVLNPLKMTHFVALGAPNRDYAASFVNATGEGIPLGEYMAQVRAGDINISGRVRVAQSATLVVLSGPDYFIDSGIRAGPLADGRVIGLNETGPVWIKILRIFGDDVCCTNTLVSKAGTFSLGRLEPGTYKFLLLHDGGIILEGTISVRDPAIFIEADIARGSVTVRPR